jgi:hypothetical protein
MSIGDWILVGLMGVAAITLIVIALNADKKPPRPGNILRDDHQ